MNRQELNALLEKQIATRQQQIQETPPDQAHPWCDCGHSLLEHLQEDLKALLGFQSYLAGELEFEILMEGESYGYPLYIVAQLTENDFEVDEDLADEIVRLLETENPVFFVALQQAMAQKRAERLLAMVFGF